MKKLQVIVASTRPGRIGLDVAQWFAQEAQKYAGFEVEVVDLQTMNLPLFNEAAHPRTGEYVHEATKAWSAKIAEGDAFVFVTPEYNFMPPPSLVNALDYLFSEWNYKPCAFVSYGGQTAGVRAVQVLKQMVTTLKMMPMLEGVALPMAWELLDGAGGLKVGTEMGGAAQATLAELDKWATALQSLRS